MKRFLYALTTVLFLALISCRTTAQGLSVESLLDKKALSLSQKGDKVRYGRCPCGRCFGIGKRGKGSNGSLKDKLLGKAGDLKALIPLASSGKLSGGALGEVVNAVKMLIGANRISGLLGKGDLRIAG